MDLNLDFILFSDRFCLFCIANVTNLPYNFTCQIGFWVVVFEHSRNAFMQQNELNFFFAVYVNGKITVSGANSLKYEKKTINKMDFNGSKLMQ